MGSVRRRSLAIGKPGGHIWSERLRPSIWDLVKIFLCFVGVAFAVWWGRRLDGDATASLWGVAWIPLVGLIGIAAFVAVLWRWIRPWLFGWLGERQVSRSLEALIADGFVVLNDVYIDHGNIDHVVVGPTGVFAIETKAWRGRVWVGPQRRLMVGARDANGARGQVVSQAKRLRSMLADAGFELYVPAVIALPSTQLVKSKIELHQADVCEADELAGSIKRRRFRLQADQISVIRGLIEPYINGKKRGNPGRVKDCARQAGARTSRPRANRRPST